MTYIKRFEQKEISLKKALHKPSRGSYSAFERDGEKFIQLVSYGLGQKPDKVAQTLQLDRDGAQDLYLILKRTFGFD
jgi:hypothetical protein